MERLIGSMRAECLDHIIVFGERPLDLALASYYHNWRTHLSLGNDARRSRRIQSAEGKVVEIRYAVVCTITMNAGPLDTIHHTPAPDRVPEITHRRR